MGIFKVGPCGIDGGEPFSMDNIDNITRISKIGVSYSTHIQAIRICVIFFGVEVCVEWGEKGGDSQEFSLQPGECITSVKGYYGRTSDDDWNGMRGLTFETSNKNEYTYGNEVGTQFELPAINGTIIGFHGRAGTAGLHALGVHIKVDDIDGSTGTGQ